MERRVVVLDAAGTLLELAAPVGETYAALAQEAGFDLDPSSLTEAFHRELREAPPLAFGALAAELRRAAERDWWRRLVRAVLAGAGAVPDPAAQDELAFERFFDLAWARFAEPRAWRVPADVRAALRALRRRGLPLAVLSNWDARLEGLLDRLGLGGYFARVLVSGDLTAAKPDPGTFAAAREELVGLGTGSPVMVGDRIDHDVEPALEAGWGAIWLDRRDRAARPPAGASRVRSLRELPGHPLLESA